MKNWPLKLIGVLLACLCIGGIYAYLTRRGNDVHMEAEKKVINQQSVITSKTTTRIDKKLDGSQVTTIVEEKITAKEKMAMVDRSTNATIKSQYRIGMDYIPRIDRPLDEVTHKDLELRVGARIGESDIWVEAGYSIKHSEIKIGVTYEF